MNFGSVVVRADGIFLCSKTSTVGLMPTQPPSQCETSVALPTRGKSGQRVKLTSNFHVQLWLHGIHSVEFTFFTLDMVLSINMPSCDI